MRIEFSTDAQDDKDNTNIRFITEDGVCQESIWFTKGKWKVLCELIIKKNERVQPCARCRWYPPSRPKEMDGEDKMAMCYPCTWSSVHADNFYKAKAALKASASTVGQQPAGCNAEDGAAPDPAGAVDNGTPAGA